MTEDCLMLDEKPDAVLVNFNSMGYCQVRFDDQSLEHLIDNLRYMKHAPTRTYIWRTFVLMVKQNHLPIKSWFRVLSNNLQFESEEQTLEVVLDEVLVNFKHGLLTEDQILAIFNTVSKMELQIVDEAGISKSALINAFCSEIVATGIVIPPDDFTPQSCYEVIGYQCKSKQQMYTFIRLLFSNPGVALDTKLKFLRGL